MLELDPMPTAVLVMSDALTEPPLTTVTQPIEQKGS
jgi:hypothetical protein